MNSCNSTNLFTPDYSQLTGLLKFLNTEELKSILNNDERTIEIINDLKQVKDIEAEKEMLIASNKSISEYNLSQKSVIEEYRDNLDSTFQRAVELKDKLLAAKSAIESKPVAQSNDTLLALLQAATSEIEEEAEATVDAFLKNDLSVEDFLEKYLELRKLAHLRRIKSEKLSSIIHDGGTGSGTTPVKPMRLRKPPPPPVPNSSTLPQQNNALPYPSNINSVNQNIPLVPSRPAPQPPPVSVQNFPYPNPSHPSPFTYYSPYPVPSQYPNYRPF